jgi:hypothetical protein
VDDEDGMQHANECCNTQPIPWAGDGRITECIDTFLIDYRRMDQQKLRMRVETTSHLR